MGYQSSKPPSLKHEAVMRPSTETSMDETEVTSLMWWALRRIIFYKQKLIFDVPRFNNTTQLIFDVKYPNLLAPQATPKENVNIVLNYPYKSLLYSKKDSSAGRVHGRCWDERQIPCAAIYLSLIHI